MYACMHVCMYVCMYICTYAKIEQIGYMYCIHACIHTSHQSPRATEEWKECKYDYDP